jgi:hypothetical protein
MAYVLPFVNYWLAALPMGNVPSKQISLFGPIQPSAPCTIVTQSFRIPEDNQTAPRPSNGHIQATPVAQKTNFTVVVSTNS